MNQAALDQTVRDVAGVLAADIMRQGAIAVLLAGSWTRGQAHRESDLDLYALGPGAPYTLKRRRAYLVSISYRTPEEVRTSFSSPGEVGSVIPGWREAVILVDTDGIAEALQSEARRWTWDIIGEEGCNEYVASALTGWAEEVHKLVVALEREAMLTAATQRSLLALGLAPRVAVHLRLLYGSENLLWDVVGDCLGEGWRRAQHAALGVNGDPFDTSCQAALELYALAARAVHHLLDEEQRAVVDHACLIAGFPL